MQLIETKTLLSATASIQFTSIPQDGTDLKMVFSAREATTSNVAANVLVNGSTSNLTERLLFGSGSGTGSASSSAFNVYIAASTRTANTFGNGEVYVTNYASTTDNKSLSTDSVEENNATQAFSRIGAGLYSSNIAITSLGIQAIGGNLAVGTTASLYKITKGSGGATVS
jgi:hypothetical protein